MCCKDFRILAFRGRFVRLIRDGGTNASTNHNAATRVYNGVGGQKVAGAFQPREKGIGGKEEFV